MNDFFLLVYLMYYISITVLFLIVPHLPLCERFHFGVESLRDTRFFPLRLDVVSGAYFHILSSMSAYLKSVSGDAASTIFTELGSRFDFIISIKFFPTSIVARYLNR